MTSWNVELRQTVGVHGNVPDAQEAVKIALAGFPSMTSRLEIVVTPVYDRGTDGDDE